MSERSVQPIYLLADSQLLFWKGSAGPFLASVCQASEIAAPSVAYIGASNGDSPEAYSILIAALDQIQVRSKRHITAALSAEDREFLEQADIVVLAGGDVEAGWNVFTRTGLRQVIESRYREGAVLIGVSAGAIQLGTHAALAGESGNSGDSRLIETFGLVRLILDVHDEQRDWQTLSSTIHLLEGSARGVGVPSGAGLIAHPDGTLEPIRRGLEEFTFSDGKLRRAVLLPDLVSSAEPAPVAAE
ncbi:MAG: Type 1 glutamine amidotransferase-like domain-containing protein [Gammaproteobacteria bacterium]